MPSTRVYPDNWQQIRRHALLRAGYRCEHCGMFFNPQCKSVGTFRRDGKPFILTVHHLDDNSQNNEPSNLAALCQRCHLFFEVWTVGAEIPQRWGKVPELILKRKLAYTWQTGFDHA